MPSAITSRHAPFGAITIYRFVTSFANAMQVMFKWNAARHTRNALNKLNDHQLADIGLGRDDIEAIARKI